MKRYLLMVLVLATLIPLMAGCAPAATPTTQMVEKIKIETKIVEKVVTATPQPTPGPKRGGTLIWAWIDEVLGLDPHKNTMHRTLRLYELVYSTMTRLAPDLSVQPELCESWEIKGDTVYIFHLRKGVKFHNGEELTAEDVKFSYERILNPDTASPAKSFVEAIQKIETPDQYTVVITLSRPSAAFLSNIAHPNTSIVSKKVATTGDLAKDVVGTGAFKLAEWVPDNYMRLVRNPDFYIPGQPYLDAIEWRIIPDRATILAGLRTGQIDLADLDAKNAQLARASRTLIVDTAPMLTYTFLGFNCEREPFTDPRVRLALSYAVDRQAVIDAVLLGEGEITGPIPPSLKQWALPVSEYPNYTQDLDKAKALLAEAGYPNGFEFTIMTWQTPEGTAISQVLQDQLKAIGVQAKIEQLERGLWIANWKESKFDAFESGNSGSPDPDFMLYRTFHSEGATNVFKFKNEKVDQLLEKAQFTVDYKQRKAYYDELQRELVQSAPMVWLYVANQFRVHQQYVKGVIVMPDTSIVYAREWWLDK